MKIFITIILLFNSALLFSGTLPSLVVSAPQPEFGTGVAPMPIENQNLFLWRPITSLSCVSLSNTYVSVSGFEINVFNEVSSGVCADPLPPIYTQVAELNSLSAGTYNLNYHSVPVGDTFPPNSSDYSNYFDGSIQFGVILPRSIDLLSNIGLLLLVITLLLMGSFSLKHNRKLN